MPVPSIGRIVGKIKKCLHGAILSGQLEPRAAEELRGSRALRKLLKDFEFDSVLDIGGGAGKHAEEFLKHGKDVTVIDYGKSIYFQQKAEKVNAIVADFNTYDFGRQFDCVWCSHCLEHQLNVQGFLEKINQIIRGGGYIGHCCPATEA